MEEFSAWSRHRFPCQGSVKVGGWPGTGFMVVSPLLVTDAFGKAGMLSSPSGRSIALEKS